MCPAKEIILGGIVQGVGFRPFVYRHANHHQIQGWVRNSSGRVEIHAQGERRCLDAFVGTLIDNAPPLSRPYFESVTRSACISTDDFLILESRADADADIHLPADLFTCDECLRELNDPADRRYRYPFINCTQCGPRFTLIEALPYDRRNTSMAAFPLCAPCQAEYSDPYDRRYHAEPIACPVCGPALTYRQGGGEEIRGNEAALEAALAALTSGQVIAVKGIGGYHLVCDACNDDAVTWLRKHKPRPDKPLAVMFPAPLADPLAGVRQYLQPGALEAELLISHARPIVLVAKKPGNALGAGIAPGLNEVGAMLPYSPLHHVLLNDFGTPLVATSANISGEPVLTKNTGIESRLAHVANAFLHHDRPIVRPADDPVMRVINERPLPVRLGRGLAPLEVELPFHVRSPVLGTGAQMKNTVALAWENRLVVSPHIGEMESPRSFRTFEQCISDLQALYQVRAEHIVCDAHRGFTPSRWAHGQELPVHEVFHHHAHASAAWLEALRSLTANNETLDDMLVFTWDGVGLGPDGTLWGGEGLLGRPGRWRRVASFRPFHLPGGERAAREPWRSAAAICWEDGQECPLDAAKEPLLYSFWEQGKNAPQTSAAGRLFDAASALCGLGSCSSFEGQGPMYLEALAQREGDPADTEPLEARLSLADGVYLADWASFVPLLTDTRRSPAHRALDFHLSMAGVLLAQAQQVRTTSGVSSVALSGGVFQNRILTAQCIKLLSEQGFSVCVPASIPVNDAGISFGQIIDYAYQGGN